MTKAKDEPAEQGLTRRQFVARAGASGAAIAIPGVVSGLLAGCGTSSASSPKTLRIGHARQIDSLNPFVAQNNISFNALQPIFPFLVGLWGPNLVVVPDFATHWDIAPDARQITFTTAGGGKWTDGKPLTANDAAFTINMTVKYQKGPTAINGAQAVNGIKDARATSDTTLVVNFERPVANALIALSGLPILPEHIWSAFATGSGSKISTFSNQPPKAVTCGPFKLVKYAQNEIALYERYDGRYGASPHLDGCGFQYYGTEDALVTAMNANEVDATYIETGSESIKTLSKNTHLAKIQHQGYEYYYVGFNSNPKKPHHRELLNPQVRKALSHAIDRQQIVSVGFFGYATPGSTFIPPSGWNDTRIPVDSYDLALSNQILDSLGYHRSSSGVRMVDGHPMSYVLNQSSDLVDGNRVVSIIQNSFNQIGVQITPKVLDASAMYNAVSGPNLKYLTADIDMWDWAQGPDPSYMLSVLTTAQIGGLSDTAFSNQEYDKLFTQQSSELNVQRRHALVDRMQQIVAAQRPMLPLAYSRVFVFYSKKFTGFSLAPNGFTGAKKNFLDFRSA